MPRITPRDLVYELSNYLRHGQLPQPEIDYEEAMLLALEKQDYSTVIRLADDHYAQLQNVKKIKINGNDDLDIIVFDTRQIRDIEEQPYSDYLRIAVNYVRAALVLCETQGKLTDDYQEKMNNLVISLYHSLKVSKKPNSDLNAYNWYLRKYLAEQLGISSKQAQKRLQRAKDYVNLGDPSYHYCVIGIDKLNKKSVPYFIADIGIGTEELTDEQRNEIEQRKHHLKLKQNELERTQQLVAVENWYYARPLWVQKLIDYFTPNLLDENHVIPTQLRDDIPGIRNAALQVNGYYNEDKEQFDIDMEVFHSGATTFLGDNRKENARLTKQNRDQLNIATGGHGILKLTLNDEYNIFHIDKDVVNYTNKVMDGEEFIHANIAPNPLRRITPNISDGINEQLDTVIEHLDELLPGAKYQDCRETLVDFLSRKTTKLSGIDARADGAIKKVRAIQNDISPKNYQLIYAAVMCRSFMRRNSKFYDPENLNLHISTMACIVNHQLRRSNILYKTLVLACLSGKDRTREVLLNVVTYQKFYKAKGYYPYENYPEMFLNPSHQDTFSAIYKELVNSGFQQYLAGSERTSLGCTGLKSGLRKPPKSYPSALDKNLRRKTSMYNSSLPTKKNGPVYHPRVPCLESVLMQLEYTKKHLEKRRTQATRSWGMFFYSQRIVSQRIDYLGQAIDKIKSGEISDERSLQELLRQLKNKNADVVKGTLHSRGETYEITKQLYYEVAGKRILG